MAKRAIICVGDTTTHGGKVLEGAPTFTLNGRNVAGVGHKVLCPRCKGIFPILPDLLGRRYPHTIGERDTAVEGMRTACGAELIASQGTGTIDDVGAGERGDGGSPGGSAAVAAAAVVPSPTLCLECLKAAAKNAATMVARG
ncbi:PAAR domain-containing protein [Burkholderia pseudomallei]|uniref:PAAR domain-containing protein n=3 Tax=Burkholderia pseudomallei TaxID=28450 RepID=UPI000717FD69|nr:PAAR domain-containing protein [Burkholderia pseudomallei]MBM5688059.1 PAAR domain-containing protein [Burkholderia pseudomallei]MBR7788034.1 PAAR domain-containing protein [Burkholderia pseudomallei]MCW0132311.1 PAAR domain-containing protein [Burkholderia pseudomallei]NAW74179.1 PAAR domain-containing protein [Burkholderia pseudomallei]NAX59150.1 PAAR domain-containing protein [Burkholderia pseudomallei]